MVRVLSDRSGSQPPVGYPERFRVRLAGRIDQVWIPPLDAKPVYRAELVVAKSRLLQRVSPLAVLGIPLVVEPPGEDIDDSSNTPASKAVSGPLGAKAPTETSELAAFARTPPFEPGSRVSLIWHGQRLVPGVMAGSLLRCSGMLSQYPGDPRIYNPRYEIVPQLLLTERTKNARYGT